MTLRAAKDRALNDARNNFFDALRHEGERLDRALAAARVPVDEQCTTEDELRSAWVVAQRVPWMGIALRNFEYAILPTLRDYVALANRHHDEPVLWHDAQAVLCHMRLRSPLRPDVNWLSRVIISAKHTYRAWRRIRSEQGTDRR